MYMYLGAFYTGLYGKILRYLLLTNQITVFVIYTVNTVRPWL